VRAILATVGVLAVAGSAAGRAPARLHARASSDPIYALAQDGHLLAWLTADGEKCNSVHVQGLGALRSVPQPAAESMTCHWDLSDQHPQLAVAARASAVMWTLHEGGDSPSDYVLTAQFGGAEQRVDRLAHTTDGIGSWLQGVTGSGKTLAYSWVDVEYVDELSCLSGGSCKRHIAGGGIKVVNQGLTGPLPGVGPALELAAAAGDVAYVQASRVRRGRPAANASAPVEVVDAVSGTTVSAVQPQGVPTAIALAPHLLAVLTRQGRQERISWYNPSDGTTLGSLDVSGHTAAQLATSDQTIVYRVGRWLRAISVRSGQARKLVRTAGTPTGLTLERGRLAWAENHGSTGRIRTLAVG
jgi:hypothetical protein